jgi:hypothetical protein
LDDNVLNAGIEGSRRLQLTSLDSFGQLAYVEFYSTFGIMIFPLHVSFTAVTAILWPVFSAGYVSDLNDVFKARDYLASVKPCYNSDSFDIFVDYFTRQTESLIPVRGLYISLVSFSAISLF